MIKTAKLMLVILILVSVSVLFAGCNSKSDVESQSQVATVQRGNLSVDITAAGNLSLSRSEDLAF